MLEFSPSMDWSSSSLQTMIVNKNWEPSDSDFSLLISNQMQGNEEILEVSNFAENHKYDDKPQRHISALNYVANERKSTYESSMSLAASSSNINSDVKNDDKHEIPFDGSIKSNTIKIIHGSQSSDQSNNTKMRRITMK